MNETTALSEIGYLVVRVTTALGAIPLENASVTVRGTDPENEHIVYSLVTDSDGKTERIELPAPPRANSETPYYDKPYSLYGIDIFANGYIPLYLNEVPVFSSVTSIQPAIMLPYLEGEKLRG